MSMDEVLYDKTGNIRDVNTVLVPLDKLRELQTLARRYCWLRDECEDWFQFQGFVECEPEGLDDAIDAAIAATLTNPTSGGGQISQETDHG
jgi:hypothetical protein